jgi:hypothetical protein
MGIEYTSLFHSKALQNLHKVGLFGLKIYYPATLTSVTNTHNPRYFKELNFPWRD